MSLGQPPFCAARQASSSARWSKGGSDANHASTKSNTSSKWQAGKPTSSKTSSSVKISLPVGDLQIQKQASHNELREELLRRKCRCQCTGAMHADIHCKDTGLQNM